MEKSEQEHLLADTNVSYLALVDQFLEFLPRGIRVRG
jgi:hypothetical protein